MDTVDPVDGPSDDVATPAVLVPFDVDCGEVVPGRHLWLRGLLDDGTWPDALGHRLPVAAGACTQMVSLAWEVVPPVAPDDPDAVTWYQSDLATVRYEVEPPLSRDVEEAPGVGGGSIDTPPGRPSARGTEGPYPLSPGAQRVTFTVVPFVERRRGGAAPGTSSWVVRTAAEPIGRLVVDLAAGTARWTPTAAD